MVYQSDESGRYEVYVQHVPPDGHKFQISSAGGVSPRWRRDGRELFYVASGPKMMAVPVKAGGTFEPGQAKVIFENAPIVATRFGAFFEPSTDGQRFLTTAQAEGETAADTLSVVLNWQAGR